MNSKNIVRIKNVVVYFWLVFVIENILLSIFIFSYINYTLNFFFIGILVAELSSVILLPTLVALIFRFIRYKSINELCKKKLFTKSIRVFHKEYIKMNYWFIPILTILQIPFLSDKTESLVILLLPLAMIPYMYISVYKSEEKMFFHVNRLCKKNR